MKRALTFHDNKYDKFWFIDYSGKEFATCSGKIGENGNFHTKRFESEEECKKQAMVLIGKRLAKGYRDEPDFDYDTRCYFDDPKEGLSIKTSHPYFRTSFRADFYYDAKDAECPLGCEEGRVVLEEFESQFRARGVVVIDTFLKTLFPRIWNMEYAPVDGIDETQIQTALDSNPEAVSNMDRTDRAVIAAALAQVKVTGSMTDRMQFLAQLAVLRQSTLRRLAGKPPSIHFAQLLMDLQDFSNKEKEYKPTELCTWVTGFLGCPCQIFGPARDDDNMLFAFEQAIQQGEQQGFTPVLISVEPLLWKHMQENASGVTPEDAKKARDSFLSEAEGIDTKAWIKEKLEDRKEDCEEKHIRWERVLGEQEGGETSNTYNSYWNFRIRRTKEVILAKLPTNKPWEAPAWVPVGGENSPTPAERVAMLRYLHQEYGVVPACMSYEELELRIKKPLGDAAKAHDAALESFAFSRDRILRYRNRFYNAGRLADELSKSTIWYFWWDIPDEEKDED